MRLGPPESDVASSVRVQVVSLSVGHAVIPFPEVEQEAGGH